MLTTVGVYEVDQSEYDWEAGEYVPNTGRRAIRVILAEDHDRVRAGIRMLLEATADIEVVGEASNGAEALALTLYLQPEVLLLDIEMPVMSGSQVLAKLRTRRLPTRVLALSTYNDPQFIRGILRRGADAYLVKDEVTELLLPAVRSVARGQQGWIKQPG